MLVSGDKTPVSSR